MQRPPVPADLLPRMLDYLEQAPVVDSLDGFDTDLLAPERTEAVPLVFHTDGVWVWPGAVAYYLRQHRVPPDPGLVEHMVRRGFELPEVDAATEEAARAHLLRLRGAAPKPPAPPGPGPMGPGGSAGPTDSSPRLPTPPAPAPPPPAEPPAAATALVTPLDAEPEPSAPASTDAPQPTRPPAESARPAPPPDLRTSAAPPDSPPTAQEPPTVLARPDGVDAPVEATQWIAPGQQPATPAEPPPAHRPATAVPARTPATSQWIEPGRRSERTRQLRRRVAPAPLGSAVLRELQRLLVVFDADPAAYRLNASEDGAWCLVRENDRWVVFRADAGERRDVAEFADCEPAARYLLGAVLSDMAGAAEATSPGGREAGRDAAAWPEEDPDPVR
nr:hypothetical protein GCM10020241_43460 [Streptoalloteichus tenebrarius]